MQNYITRRRDALIGRRKTGRRSIVVAATLLASLSLAADAKAQVEAWGTGYDVLLERPGVTVSTETRDDGTEERRFELPGGVEIIEERKDGEVSSFRVDNSGHGAVLCSWGITIALATWVETCPALHSQTNRTRYLDAVPRINRFIRDNMFEPVTLEQVEAAAAERRKAAVELYESESDPASFCTKSEYAKFIEAYGELSDQEFQAFVDKLLSVPRLPVMGPCF